MQTSGHEFAPGVADALAKISAAENAAGTPEPVSSADIRFLGDKPRRVAVPLQWPLSFDGREYYALVVRRLSVGQVANYVAEVNEAVRANRATNVRLPMFEAEDGSDLPDGLLDALDADDMTKLNEAASDFLPQSFRPKAEEAP